MLLVENALQNVDLSKKARDIVMFIIYNMLPFVKKLGKMYARVYM